MNSQLQQNQRMAERLQNLAEPYQIGLQALEKCLAESPVDLEELARQQQKEDASDLMIDLLASYCMICEMTEYSGTHAGRLYLQGQIQSAQDSNLQTDQWLFQALRKSYEQRFNAPPVIGETHALDAR